MNKSEVINIKYAEDSKVREEAMSHLQQLEILMQHIYRNNPIWRGITAYNVGVLKDHLQNCNNNKD